MSEGGDTGQVEIDAITDCIATDPDARASVGAVNAREDADAPPGALDIPDGSCPAPEPRASSGA